MTEDQTPTGAPETPSPEPVAQGAGESAAEPLQPGDLVTIGNEQPLRMSAITGSRLGSDGPAAPKRQSAIAAYEAPLTFDWRNRPLGGPPRQR